MVPGPQTNRVVTTPAAAGTATAVAAVQPSPIARLGAPLMLVFLFLATGRLADFAGHQLRLPLILGTLAVLLALINGALARALKSRPGQLLTAFTLWMVLITPLSYWRGGSVNLLANQWLKSIMVYVMIAGLAQTLRQCRQVMNTLAVAVLAAALIVLYFGTLVAGRLAAPVGMLENPNDLAQILLLGLPFWYLLLIEKSRVPFRRLLAALCAAPVLYVFLQTGSRGGLVAFAAMCAVIFVHASAAGRFKLMLVCMVIAITVLVTTPEAVTARLAVTLKPEVTEQGFLDSYQMRAIESSQQRLSLFKESVELTIRNPLFGVGPGQFQSVQAKKAGEEGERAMWRETHCMYTQLSSENGLPGLFLYAAALFFCVRSANRIYKSTRNRPETADIAAMSYAILLSLIGFAATALFSSVAYHMFFPTLAGLSTAFARAVERELAARGVPNVLPAHSRRSTAVPSPAGKATARA